ncbi:MAG: DMT family transporter [Pseudomonadota bacterium]
MNPTILALIAFLTGAMVPLQLAFNGQLGTALKSPYLGAFFVLAIGLLATGKVILARRVPGPEQPQRSAVPWTGWVGGLIATAYIIAIVFLVPRLGVGSTAVLIIAGQLVAALILDQLGAFGAPQVSLSITRVRGGALVLAGAALVKFT